MSKATQYVVGTVGAAAILSIVVVLQIAFA